MPLRNAIERPGLKSLHSRKRLFFHIKIVHFFEKYQLVSTI